MKTIKVGDTVAIIGNPPFRTERVRIKSIGAGEWLAFFEGV